MVSSVVKYMVLFEFLSNCSTWGTNSLRGCNYLRISLVVRFSWWTAVQPTSRLGWGICVPLLGSLVCTELCNSQGCWRQDYHLCQLFPVISMVLELRTTRHSKFNLNLFLLALSDPPPRMCGYCLEGNPHALQVRPTHPTSIVSPALAGSDSPKAVFLNQCYHHHQGYLRWCPAPSHLA